MTNVVSLAHDKASHLLGNKKVRDLINTHFT